MTDVAWLLLRRLQAVFFGQQNSNGKPSPHWSRSLMPPHTASCCREKMLDACMGVMRRQKRDSLESLVSPVERPMMELCWGELRGKIRQMQEVR
jgi:hypothetical protein